MSNRHVDAASRDQINGLLAELNKNMTIILVTHICLPYLSQVSAWLPERTACLTWGTELSKGRE
jgi:ABC-type phosphate transport system ATPase subunit